MKDDPKKDVNAALDFFLIVFKGQILAEASCVLGVANLDEEALPPDIQKQCLAEQQKVPSRYCNTSGKKMYLDW